MQTMQHGDGKYQLHQLYCIIGYEQVCKGDDQQPAFIQLFDANTEHVTSWSAVNRGSLHDCLDSNKFFRLRVMEFYYQ